MNKSEAEEILDEYASTHSTYGRWSYGDAYYDAEFYIKINPGTLYDITDEQQEWLEAAFFDVLGWELESFIDLEVELDKYPPEECWQEGRSGGWLVCRWFAPENGRDILKLARAVKRIADMVKIQREYIESDEFWLDMLEHNCPAPVKRNPIVKIVDDWSDSFIGPDIPSVPHRTFYRADGTSRTYRPRWTLMRHMMFWNNVKQTKHEPVTMGLPMWTEFVPRKDNLHLTNRKRGGCA